MRRKTVAWMGHRRRLREEMIRVGFIPGSNAPRRVKLPRMTEHSWHIRVGLGAIFVREQSEVGLNLGVAPVRLKERGKVCTRVREKLFGDKRDWGDCAFDVQEKNARRCHHAWSVVDTRGPKYAGLKQGGWYSRSTPDSV